MFTPQNHWLYSVGTMMSKSKEKLQDTSLMRRKQFGIIIVQNNKDKTKVSSTSSQVTTNYWLRIHRSVTEQTESRMTNPLEPIAQKATNI